MLVMDQGESGCDYTIGCGKQYHLFDAENAEEAKLEAEKYWCDGVRVENCEYSPYHTEECSLERMYLCEIIEMCPIEEWKEIVDGREERKKAEELGRKERAELKRLLKKYGPQ